MNAVRAREFFYVSNLLSITRIFLAVPVYYFLSLETKTGNYLAVVTMLLAAATDNFDGRLARKLHQQSDLGRILDPVADKISMAIIAIMLVKTRNLPLWFLIFVVSRDLLILMVGLLISMRTKIVVESNKIGKITVCALGLVLVVYTLQINSAKAFFLWSSVALLIASSLSYFWKTKKMIL